MHKHPSINLISWKKKIDHSWVNLHSFVVNPMHAFGRSSWEGGITIIVRHRSHLGCEQCLELCSHDREVTLQVRRQWSQKLQSHKTVLPAIFSLLFCWVFCELLFDESSLRFAFSSCSLNFPEAQFQSCKTMEKKIAKNETKLCRGKIHKKISDHQF